LLTLLAILRHLGHLLLQPLSLAPQHLLLPTLLKALRTILRLLRQFLLSASQRIQLRQSVVYLFLLLLSRRSRLRRLILVLLGI
jgi:hypothetical protein